MKSMPYRERLDNWSFESTASWVIRALLARRPFAPFTMILDDRSRFVVDRAEQLDIFSHVLLVYRNKSHEHYIPIERIERIRATPPRVDLHPISS